MGNSSPEFFATHSGVRRELATDEIELLVVNLEKGPSALETALDEALAGPWILKEVLKAEEEGCDAIVLDCAADPVLRAARQITSLPVVAAGQASHMAAMMLCDKFSIITTLPASIPLFKENVIKYGYTDRVASVRAANLPVLGLEDADATFAALSEQAGEAIEKDGAEAIVLGCTGMLPIRDRLQAYLNIPVIEPLTTAINFAANLVKQNLAHSKLTYADGSDASMNLLKKL